MNKTVVTISDYINGYNSFDIPAMTKHLLPSIVFDNIQNDTITMHLEEVEAFATQAEAAKVYFSERKQTPTNLVHYTDRTEVDIAYYGIVAIDLPNGFMKGDLINLNGKSFFYFDGSTIAKIVDIS